MRTTAEGGTPVLLADVARIQLGPEMRRGIAELDGEGEVVGGVIVLRSGKNAWARRSRMSRPGSPSSSRRCRQGVEIVETYDRSALIERAVTHLRDKLFEEFVVVAIVCLVFLLHLRSALVAVVSLPLGILAAFVVMHAQGVNADIMSLGGIAIAIGAMVDAAIVMIENAHKKLEAWRSAARAGEGTGGRPPEPSAEERWKLVVEASVEVGPALFFSLLVITLSFVPVFALEAQEGRMFKPLAFTKTYAMAAAAGLAITLVPVLMGYFIRGRIPAEARQPDQPLPDRRLPPAAARRARLAEDHAAGGRPRACGDGLAVPAARRRVHAAARRRRPALHADRAAGAVRGQGGRDPAADRPDDPPGSRGGAGVRQGGAPETATDPAPMEMIETTIQFKPKDQWRPGMTTDRLIEELDRTVKVPGLSNIWVPPIRNRIDMLAETGIEKPDRNQGGRGSDLARGQQRLAREIEAGGAGRCRA